MILRSSTLDVTSVAVHELPQEDNDLQSTPLQRGRCPVVVLVVV